MDTLDHAVTFPVNEMLLADDVQASEVVGEMGDGGQQSFVFSSEGGATTLVSLPFALLHDSGLIPTATNGGSTGQPTSATNTTNIIIKQSSAASHHQGLHTNTIFLDAAQMALLSSGAGQVVLTDTFLEDGQNGGETQQIFLQVTSDALGEEEEVEVGVGQKESVSGETVILGHAEAENQVALQDMGDDEATVPERRPVLPKAKRGPGRPRRDDSKMIPPSVKGVWFCQICGREFGKWPLLKKHLKSHLDDKPHRCSKCTASFNVPWNLKLHEATHVSPDTSAAPLKCPACSRTFSRMASLKAHVMLHEEDESLFCAQCSEEFSVQSQLDEHMKMHNIESSSLDPLAPEQPTVALPEGAMQWVVQQDGGNNLIGDGVHSFGPAGDQPGQNGDGALVNAVPRAPGHRCRLCNALFRKASQLREHMREHSKVKASLLRRNHKRNIDRSSFLHKCKNCMKGFQKPSQLVRHMRIHTGERPYECLTCGRAFNQKGSLQIHMTKHSGIKPFTCEFCSAGFRQRGNLRAHILRVHTIPVSGEQAFRCCECPCVFRKLGSLNAHVSRVHGHSTTTTTTNNAAVRKRKMTDGSGVGDSLDEDVSDVLRDLAELEEATRRLGGPSGAEGGSGGVGQERQVGGAAKRRGAEEGSGGDASVVVHPSDILQQALEKSGLSGEGGKRVAGGSTAGGGVGESVMEDSVSMPRNDASVILKREEYEGGGSQSGDASADGRKDNSQCVLTLADKAHDGTVRRYSIKVRCLAGVRWHQCTYCPKEFRKPSDLVRHIRIHTHEKPYKCYMCFRAFAVKSTLTVHLRIHSGLKSYECPTCNKKFASQSSLKVHQRLHSGLKPFACPYCNLRFRTTGHRKTHVSTHFRLRSRTSRKVRRDGVSGEGEASTAVHPANDMAAAIQRVFLRDPIVVVQPPPEEEGVEDDDEMMPSNGELVDARGERELLTQDDGMREGGSGETTQPTAAGSQVSENRPHSCTHCNSAFKKLSHLKQHIRSHTGEKPFRCTTCEKSFVSRGVLRSHLKTHVPIMTPSRRPFECNECGKKFVAAGSLKRHVVNAHENTRKKMPRETFLCPYCDYPPFNSNKSCRRHIMSHTAELVAAQEREVESAHHHQLHQQMQVPGAEHDAQGEEQQMMVAEGTAQGEDMQGEEGTQGDSGHQAVQYELRDHTLQDMGDGTQLAVISEGHVEDSALKVRGEEEEGVMGEQEANNVVVTFSLDFPTTDALGNQVINHQVSIGGEEEGGSATQAVATISLTDADGLTQESLHQIEQTLSTGMFADAMDGTADAASAAHHNAQAAIKDAATAGIDLHTISFDPSVFSNITLPTGEALGLHASLQPIVDEAMSSPQPQPITVVTTTSESPVHNGGGGKGEDPRVRKKKVHECTYCNRIFKKCSHLKQHLRTHTGEKPYQCLVCMRMFVTMGTLKAHFRTHTGEKSFGCTTCGAHFTTNGSLRRHMFVHSNEGRVYHCERCQQTFRTLGHWRRHWRSHENELIGNRAGAPLVTVVDGGGTQECTVVIGGGEDEEGGDGGDKEGEGEEATAMEEEPTPQQQPVSAPPMQTAAVSAFRRGAGGMRSRRIAAAVGAAPSSLPSSGVIRLSEEETSRLAMQSPSQPHLTLSERVLIASAAERGRISEINDKQRQLQSAPKLPHACPHCPKSFRKPSDLARHVRTHTGERPFACDKCGRRFTVKSTLDSHRMTHPLEDGDGSLVSHPKYPCHVCGCLFATKGSLKVHMRLHTGARPFKCPHCDQRFRTSGHRKAHLLTHLRSQALGGVEGGGGMRGGRGRGRRAKAMALEAMRTIDEALRGEEGGDDGVGTVAATGVEEEDVGAVGVDWSALQANLGGGRGEEGKGGATATFVHLGQLEEGLILGQLPRGHSLDEDEGRRGQRHHLATIDEAASEVEGVTEALAFEAADEVSGLFGGHPIILDESKVQQALGGGRRDKGSMTVAKRVGEEDEEEVGVATASWARGRPLGVLDEDGNISLVIDGDFVIEEDGMVRQVMGAECVVLSALGQCEEDDDNGHGQHVDDGQ